MKTLPPALPHRKKAGTLHGIVTSNPIEGASPEETPDRDPVEDLARQAQAGDEKAFDRLVSRLAQPMYNLAWRMTGNAADADDLAQEIFVKLHRALPRFEWRSKFTTWLYALAANTCRSGLRRSGRIARVEIGGLGAADAQSFPEPADPDEGPAVALERQDAQAQIEAAIAALPEEFRTAMVLRDVQGLDYLEIAEVLGCSMGTVKSRLARGRSRVKDRLVRQGFVRGQT